VPDALAVYMHGNEKLSGAVPEAWSRFSGVIDVSSTNVTGAQSVLCLFSKHVAASIYRCYIGLQADTLAVYMHGNEKLSGAVPEAWSRFSGVIDVSSTNVTGMYSWYGSSCDSSATLGSCVRCYTSCLVLDTLAVYMRSCRGQCRRHGADSVASLMCHPQM
jgi:hypothetical protein